MLLFDMVPPAGQSSAMRDAGMLPQHAPMPGDMD
jgi:hypothetical protein